MRRACRIVNKTAGRVIADAVIKKTRNHIDFFGPGFVKIDSFPAGARIQLNYLRHGSARGAEDRCRQAHEREVGHRLGDGELLQFSRGKLVLRRDDVRRVERVATKWQICMKYVSQLGRSIIGGIMPHHTAYQF